MANTPDQDALVLKKFHPAVVAQTKQVALHTKSKFFTELHRKLEAGMTVGELNAMKSEIEAEYKRIQLAKSH